MEVVTIGTRKEGQHPGRAPANAVLRAWPPNVPVGDLTTREHEWGSAQAYLAPRHPQDSSALHLPALGLGDTGAASGLVAVGLALRDFARGWSRSDAGEVAAALVIAPGSTTTGRA